MKLSQNDIQEIRAIISSFTEEDNDRISEMVEWEDRQTKSNPLTNAMRSLCGTSVAFDLAADTCEFQEMAHKTWWDMTTLKYQFEYALGTFKERHKTWEAA